MTTYALLNEPTLYPSAYLVLTNKGYTKHYYAGAERVAARLGGGGLDALCQVVCHNDTLQEKTDELFDQSLEKVNKRVLRENSIGCILKNEFAREELGEWIDGIPRQMKAEIAIDHSQFRETVNSMMGDPNNGQETDVYYYHSDHLGSASWITDKSGIAVQHLQYLPFGEPYINQRAAGSTYSERFTFTGKERDEETGYGYFGARYMDYELTTMWLSVDPLSDKYPSISPYAYCAWNPVRLIDPDGMETIENDDGWKVDRYKKTVTRVSTEGGNGCQYINDNSSSRILLGSQQDVLNQFEGFTLIDNVQNGTQISQTEDNGNTSSDILNASVESAVGGVGRGCHKMSKAYFDGEKGTYMGRDGSQKQILQGKNGGLGGRYKQQQRMSANYSKAAGVFKWTGRIMTFYSIYSTERQFENGEISSQERWTNHAVTAVSNLPYCWHVPLFYELGKSFGPSSW